MFKKATTSDLFAPTIKHIHYFIFYFIIGYARIMHLNTLLESAKDIEYAQN
jgi:hypothetical protein